MTEPAHPQLEARSGRRRRLSVLLVPLILFGVLVAFFLAQLMSGRDASTVPSALINRPAPQTDLPPLAATSLPGLRSADFLGKVTLVNVFASWCAPCREEHPVLLALSRDERFTLAGLNYKDAQDNAAGFLRELGNPYDAIGVDASGRTGIDWGVYGVPETFVVGRDGTIAFKFVGPLSAETVRHELMPAVEAALAEVPGA
ncbi:MAG TPA: DsbE family thiol:disulfide interchange protein [Tianweitania sediminis]|nr:DsbE family thiol:disulfide interchange protein [Tianweitania sediminis]